MASLNKSNDFVQQLGNAVHNFSSHTLKIALSNTAPSSANSILTDITQISASGGYTSGGVTLSGVTWTSSSGTSKLVISNMVFTASGSCGPFRYAVLYNSSATNGNLIGWYDYGSSITLGASETFTIAFDATNGVLTLA